MEYRRVEKTGWDVSALGFGCMRFEDAETAAAAVRRAVELGVNYFDVAPCYCGSNSEAWLGAGLKGLDRSKLILTAKSSPGNGGMELCDYDPKGGFGIRTADEARRQIERSMELFGVDHLDMYHFWAVHSEVVFQEGLKKGGFFEGVLKAKEEGLFDYIGLTTHSEADEIIHFIDASPYEFDMVTMPFHPINAGRTKAIDYCAARGIGVAAMNPLGGGTLGRPIPLMKQLAGEAGAASMAQAALRFVAYTPGVTTALNGITLAEHAEEGATAMEAGPLADDARARMLERLAEAYESVNLNNLCSACGYCGQCPMGILIPKVLEAFTDMRIGSTAHVARDKVRDMLADGEEGWDPAECNACGQCEEKCPNRIPVSQLMEAAVRVWPKG
ncbi:MAG: aldo/keto reductase [Planctomycetota bacterium]|jgi:predicted aldo/keto reductase-like oxidoreductase